MAYEGSSSIPSGAMEACLKRPHKAVNTHRQRLLVAAHKSAHAPALKTSEVSLVTLKA